MQSTAKKLDVVMPPWFLVSELHASSANGLPAGPLHESRRDNTLGSCSNSISRELTDIMRTYDAANDLGKKHTLADNLLPQLLARLQSQSSMYA